MKKNLFSVAISLCMLTGFATSAYPQWVPTNWTATNEFFNLYTRQDMVFARTWDAFNGGRMFLTTDNGATWTQIGSADTDVDILSIVMVNDELLAGTWNGFYRSTNGGTSWAAVTPAGIPEDTAICSVVMITTTLFAGTRGAVYKSSDNGAAWTEIKTGIPEAARIMSFVGSGNAVFAGSDSNDVFVTTNGGTNWTAVNSGLADKHIVQLTVSGTRLFAVTLTGVFVSDNNGTSWAAAMANLSGVNCLAVVGSQLFAGTEGSGIQLSDDNGVTWAPVSSAMSAGTRVWSMAATGSDIFAGTSVGVWRRPLSEMSGVIDQNAARTTVRLTHFKINHAGSTVAVEFALPHSDYVTITIYDLTGRELSTLVNQQLKTGTYRYSLGTHSFAKGCFVLKLQAGATTDIKTVQIFH